MPTDYYGNPLKIGDKVKLCQNSELWNDPNSLPYEKCINIGGFKNGTGTIEKIFPHRWCDGVMLEGDNNPYGWWKFKLLELVPKTLYQHILKDI